MKLVLRERETQALVDALAGEHIVTSEILVVELSLALARRGSAALAHEATELIAEIDLVPVSRSVLDRAAVPTQPALRTLDAIHVATGERVAPARFATYDRRQAAAAHAAGLDVLSPE